MSDDLVMAATEWPTNAAMIADVARLYFWDDDYNVLDCTFGKGAWWRCWRPNSLTASDLRAMPEPYANVMYCAGVDFREMPWTEECFDVVAFDPPYVSVGGRTTTGIGEMHAAYGMDGAPLSPQGVQDDIDAGLAECFRVVKKGGIVLVKCQDYVSSGKLWPGTYLTLKAAYAVGFQLVDRLEHLSGPRPQPEGRGPQKHARRNYSTLFVLRRPRR